MAASLLGPVTGLPVWGQLLLILAAAVVAAKVVDFLITLLVRRAAARSDRSLDEIALQELHLPLYATIVLGAAHFSTSLLVGLPVPLEVLSGLMRRLSLSGIVLAWAFAAIRFGRRSLEAARRSETRHEFAPILKNVWTLGVVLAAFLTLIGVWGIDLTPILAAGGVAGIVIGIAARDTIANFIGGVSLFFDNTYKVGDFILLESGERGTVVDIGIRSTTMLTRDHVLVTVPNSVLNTAQVINQSAPERRMRIRIDVRIPYGTDLDRAEACMFEAAEESDSVMESPEPRARIQEHAERGIRYELQCYVRNPIRQPQARHDLYRALDAAFDREEIEPPYAGRDVRLSDEDDDR